MKAMTLERFSEQWTLEPGSGCWLWTKTHNGRGYGMFYVSPRKYQLAHRWAWILYRGEIPEGYHVLHHCDTPACVNPSHLFIGTHTDNMRDRSAKGKWAGKYAVRFSGEDIKAIRRSSDSLEVLARKFGVVRTTIRDIRINKTWKHIL